MQHDLETNLQARRRSFFMCLQVMYYVLSTSSVEHILFQIDTLVILLQIDRFLQTLLSRKAY